MKKGVYNTYPPTSHVTGRRFARVAGSLLLALVLAGLTGWGTLAIYFGDSAVRPLQTALAVAFSAAGLAAVIGIFRQGWRGRALGGFSLLFAVVLVWWFGIAPSNDRVWQPEVARLAHATIDGDRVTVHNVRNFAYRTETDFIPAYYTKTYDLAKLDSVDLFAVYWMGPTIAHTIVSFGFGGHDYLAVSIEARKEAGEGYSSIKGFFRQYELIYVVADERDVIRLRTNYRKDPPEDVYRYRLQGSAEIAKRFFLDYLKSINELKHRPRFYNTLTANCTNVIWLHAHVNPARVPFSWKVLASGYVPEYLYRMGRLDTSVPFPELTQRGYVNAVAQALGDAPDFSRRIRTGLTASGTAVPP
jgi:hypothetical protein